MIRRTIFTFLLFFTFGCLSQTKTSAEASVPAPERLPAGKYIPRTIEVAGGEPSPIKVEGLTFYIFFCMNHEFEIDGEEYSWIYCHGYLVVPPGEQLLCPFMILTEKGQERFGMIDDPLADPECKNFIPPIDLSHSTEINNKTLPPQNKRPKPKSRRPGSGFALDQNSDSREIQTPL